MRSRRRTVIFLALAAAIICLIAVISSEDGESKLDARQPSMTNAERPINPAWSAGASEPSTTSSSARTANRASISSTSTTAQTDGFDQILQESPSDLSAESQLILRTLDVWGDASDHAILDLIRDLKKDPDVASKLLKDLRVLPSIDRFGHRGRRLLLALGLIGDSRALPEIGDIILADRNEEISSRTEFDGGREWTLTRGIALNAYIDILDARPDPQDVASFTETLWTLLRRTDSTHMKIRAVQLLIENASDPTDMRDLVAAQLPDDEQYMIDIDPRHSSSEVP